MTPNLSLPDQNGKLRTLDEFRGSYVVVYFYPKDFTSGCTREACDFRDASAQLARLGAKVVGISRDTTQSHAKFDDKHGLGFTLLSDAESATAKKWGAWGTKNMYGKQVEGVKRSTFLIGPDGEIVRDWTSVKVDGHVDAVVAAIEAAREGKSPGAPAKKAAPAKKPVKR